jgi:hypothetical protein
MIILSSLLITMVLVIVSVGCSATAGYLYQSNTEKLKGTNTACVVLVILAMIIYPLKIVSFAIIFMSHIISIGFAFLAGATYHDSTIRKSEPAFQASIGYVIISFISLIIFNLVT